MRGDRMAEMRVGVLLAGKVGKSWGVHWGSRRWTWNSGHSYAGR